MATFCRHVVGLHDPPRNTSYFGPDSAGAGGGVDAANGIDSCEECMGRRWGGEEMGWGRDGVGRRWGGGVDGVGWRRSGAEIGWDGDGVLAAMGWGGDGVGPGWGRQGTEGQGLRVQGIQEYRVNGDG